MMPIHIFTSFRLFFFLSFSANHYEKVKRYKKNCNNGLNNEEKERTLQNTHCLWYKRTQKHIFSRVLRKLDMIKFTICHPTLLEHKLFSSIINDLLNRKNIFTIILQCVRLQSIYVWRWIDETKTSKYLARVSTILCYFCLAEQQDTKNKTKTTT